MRDDIDLDIIRLLESTLDNVEASQFRNDVSRSKVGAIGTNDESDEGHVVVVGVHVLLQTLIVDINVGRVNFKDGVRVIPSQDVLISCLC